MSLQGAVVLCGYARVTRGGSLLGSTVWSETLVSGRPTISAARLAANETELEYWVCTLCFEVTTDHDIFIAWGKNPDASKPNGNDDSARLVVRAGETRNVFCDPGDRFVSFDA